MLSDELAFAFETLTVTSGNNVTNLSQNVYDRPGAMPCRKALITVNPGPVVSYLVVNTATVSSTVGHKVTAYGTIIIDGWQNIKNFQTTSVSSGTTASLSISYYRGCI